MKLKLKINLKRKAWANLVTLANEENLSLEDLVHKILHYMACGLIMTRPDGRTEIPNHMSIYPISFSDDKKLYLVRAAITSYLEANLKIPKAWIEEYNTLVTKKENHKN